MLVPGHALNQTIVKFQGTFLIESRCIIQDSLTYEISDLPVLIISILIVKIEWLLEESAFISVAPTDLFFHPWSINDSHSAVLVTG